MGDARISFVIPDAQHPERHATMTVDHDRNRLGPHTIVLTKGEEIDLNERFSNILQSRR
jgi:hypothetical protein